MTKEQVRLLLHADAICWLIVKHAVVNVCGLTAAYLHSVLASS